jgi:rhodanese-related sulfurtransferase
VSETITPERAAELLASGGAQFVDVREPYEHEAGHVAGDRYIGLPQLTADAATLDKDTPVVVYCRTGSRADMAADALAASGWEAYNLEGGFVAWLEQGLPAEPDDAEAALHSPLP